MEKDVVTNMRMSKRAQDALKELARKDNRSVSSLMNIIVSDYLLKKGVLEGAEFSTDRRKFARKKVTMPVKTFLRAGSKEQTYPSVLLDISMGGVLVTYPKGSEVRFTSTGELPRLRLCLNLPHEDEELRFDCNTRHMRDTGSEIHVGATFSSPKKTCMKKLSQYLM